MRNGCYGINTAIKFYSVYRNDLLYVIIQIIVCVWVVCVVLHIYIQCTQFYKLNRVPTDVQYSECVYYMFLVITIKYFSWFSHPVPIYTSFLPNSYHYYCYYYNTPYTYIQIYNILIPTSKQLPPTPSYRHHHYIPSTFCELCRLCHHP